MSASAGILRYWSGKFRWVICAVLFFGITKNYMVRQVLGVLKATLQHEFGWNEIDYSNLVFAFQAAYAFGMLAMGKLIDRAGTRLGYGMAMVFWSLASMAHALCASLLSFGVARAALGLGESGAFPAIVTPLFVPWITLRYGWRWAFLVTGAIGFLWFVVWMAVYREPEAHPRCTADELAYIQSDAGG